MLKGSWCIPIILTEYHQMVNEGTFETLTNEHGNFPVIGKSVEGLNGSTGILETGLPITKDCILLSQFGVDKFEPLLTLQEVRGRKLDKAVVVIGNMIWCIEFLMLFQIFPDGFVDARLWVIPQDRSIIQPDEAGFPYVHRDLGYLRSFMFSILISYVL